MEPLLNYKGSFEDLDTPEQFALQLWEVSNIREKLKALICWDNFDVSVATIDDVLHFCYTHFSLALELDHTLPSLRRDIHQPKT